MTHSFPFFPSDTHLRPVDNLFLNPTVCIYTHYTYSVYIYFSVYIYLHTPLQKTPTSLSTQSPEPLLLTNSNGHTLHTLVSKSDLLVRYSFNYQVMFYDSSSRTFTNILDLAMNINVLYDFINIELHLIGSTDKHGVYIYFILTFSMVVQNLYIH